MRLSILTLLLILSAQSVFTQKVQDVLYLSNGSIIKGKIESADSLVVKIETCCGNLFVFSADEVTEILYDKRIYSERKLKKSGYINYTSMGSILGSGLNQKVAPFSLQTEHSYIIYRYMAIGGMLGYEFLQEAVMPAAINLKAYLPLQQSILFCGFSGGYSFSLENPNADYFEEASGGKMYNAEIGIMIPMSANNSFFMAIGYRYNELHYIRNDWWMGEVERSVYYNRLSVRLGMAIY